MVTTSPERSSEIIQRNTFSRIVPEMTREVVGSSQRSIVKEETLNFEVGTGTEGELQRESRETIIQIGTTNEAGAAKQGIFGRFFSKILRLFTF